MAEVDFLLTAEGRELLRRAADFDGPLLGRAAKLRRTASADQVHAVLECLELRARARAKFDRAGSMYFTPAGLEMATSQRVATFKAARFAGSARVADLCCGIGGDTLGIAAVAPTVSVDADARLVRYARENCAAYGLESNAELRCGDAAESLAGVDAVHIDPDWRELNGRRNSDPRRYRPGLDVLGRILERHSDAAVKIASAADFDSLGWDCEIELISEDRECKQAVCWFGRFRRGRRSATLLPSGRRLTDAKSPAAPVRPVGRYIYEPDPAVIRAGLIDRLAEEHGLGVLDRRIAYLTADHLVVDPAVSAFEVRDVMAWNPRKVKEHLRLAGIGRLEVKKRGIDCNPDELSRTLAGGGDRPATLILTRIGDKRTAILSSRI